MKVSQASDNPKNGEDEDDGDDDTIIGANDLSEDSDSAPGGFVGRFVAEGGETITVVERDPAWMAELRKARRIAQGSDPEGKKPLKNRLRIRLRISLRFPILEKVQK